MKARLSSAWNVAARAAAFLLVMLASVAGADATSAQSAGDLSQVVSEVVSGVVFVDTDGDGERGAGEPARAGVAVSNGRDVVVTGPDGRYALTRYEPGFVVVTCPADAECPVWFHRRASASFDFALVPREPETDFFFVQMSDAHVYEDVSDMLEVMPARGLPWYVPRAVAGWFILDRLDKMYPQHTREDIAASLREVVAEFKDVSQSWDVTVMMDYVDLALDSSTGLVEPAVEIPHALGEVAALAPRFTIHTGDMVLEGNDGMPETVERWFRYYRDVIRAAGLDPYETIGNNELGGTGNAEFSPSDPRYGRALYWKYFGPTVYSFDRGPFHFVALDTHHRLFDLADSDADEEWTFYEMKDETRDWLDADLGAARAAGRIPVVLNHEPLFYDPVWDFDDPTPVDDQGLLAKHDVPYSLSGHIHRNGFQDAPLEGGTTHITTGALSGFRWVLPLSIDDRGYRVFFAREGRLYSAWKKTDEALLGFVSPRSAQEGAIHPASRHAPAAAAVEGEVEVVGVGVDVDRPFASLSLWLGDEPLETERWGDYFVRATLDASRVPGSGRLELRARSQDGRERVRQIEIRAASGLGEGG